VRAWIKICGVRRLADVKACLEVGVDAIGFNCWPHSPRYLPAQAAADLVAAVPPSTLTVGVFVGAPPDQVERAVAVAGFQAVQLHGDEDPVDYAHLPVQIIQVLRIKGSSGLPDQVVHRSVKWVLLDAHVESYGGSGQKFDWSLIPEAKRRLAREVIIGGGLTSENVAQAIRVGVPFGVDVASGVESSPGVKDRARLDAFVQAVRSVERA
jgi:phosphoribosylanthranilate isomerase